MKWTVGSKIAAGFSFALAVFIAVGVVSYRGTAQLIDAAQTRQQSDQALESLSDARLAQRGLGVALRTYILSGEEGHLDVLRQAQQAIEQPMQRLRQRVDGDAQQEQLAEKAAALLRDYTALSGSIAEVRRGSKGASAAAGMLLAEDTRRMLEALEGQWKALHDAVDAARAQSAARAEEEARFARSVILGGNVVAVLLAVLAGWVITRDIATPLRSLTLAAERVARGDLGVDVPARSRSDEIGMLGRMLERMTKSLQDMAHTAHKIAAGDLRAEVRQQSENDMLGQAFLRMSGDLRNQLKGLADGVAVLSAAASEIVASSSQLAASATQSAAAVSQTTTTVEEVRHTAQLASQKAKLVSDSAQRAVQVSENGKRSAQDVEAGMARIRGQMDNIAAGMVELSERNQAVGEVIAAVEDLATQSNMLAVNAAIEAAKAGEHGKGFGVVAQEVKSLAEQSRQATMQVRSILGDIQKATSAAVMATEEGGKVVEAGARQAEVAGEAVQTLGGSVNEAVQAALQIAASSQQQLIGMDQVASAMESIKLASTQNVASASQLEATARNISDLGQRLKQLVDTYQV